jgi:hypothetical protein
MSDVNKLDAAKKSRFARAQAHTQQKQESTDNNTSSATNTNNSESQQTVCWRFLKRQ